MPGLRVSSRAMRHLVMRMAYACRHACVLRVSSCVWPARIFAPTACACAYGGTDSCEFGYQDRRWRC
eukprot:688380-Rhodomonas_salina.1